MRVNVTKEAKKYLTVAQMPFVNKIIKEMKEDETPIKEYCRSAIRAISGKNVQWKIFDATAEICMDERTTFDFFGEGTGILNVWINFIAFDSIYGCYEIGCLLTDIFEMADSLPETYQAVADHAYINRFVRKEQ